MTKKQLEFKRKVDRLVKEVNNLDKQGVKQTFQLMKSIQNRITLTINNGALEGWDATHIPRLKTAINRVIGEFYQQYNGVLGSLENEAFEMGIRQTDELVRIHNEMFALPDMSKETLAIWRGYSVDLVTGLSGDMRQWLYNELTLGITGEKSPFELVKTLGKRIKGYEWEKGTFYNKAWRRAEVITRTEIHRILSMSKQARENQLKDVHPDALKYWLTTSISKFARENHREVERQTNPHKGGTPIKLGEKFIVAGIECDGPHASNLPAKQVIQCGCLKIITFPELIEKKDK